MPGSLLRLRRRIHKEIPLFLPLYKGFVLYVRTFFALILSSGEGSGSSVSVAGSVTGSSVSVAGSSVSVTGSSVSLTGSVACVSVTGSVVGVSVSLPGSVACVSVTGSVVCVSVSRFDSVTRVSSSVSWALSFSWFLSLCLWYHSHHQLPLWWYSRRS